MGKIERFEDLVVWQKARELTRTLYRVTRQGAFLHDRALAGQLPRAAVSIMSNHPEGFERSRHTEFHQYVSMAKGSCAEVRSHLYVALDASHLDESVFEHLMAMATEVALLLGGLRASLARLHQDDKAKQ